MQSCPSCKSELSERGFYCPSCGAQARCKNCQDVLDTGFKFCVNCGTSIGEGSSTSAPGFNDERINGFPYNVIEFEEDTKSRRFRAKVTDHAITNVSDHLTMFMARQTGVQLKKPRQPSLDSEITVDDVQATFFGSATESEIGNVQDGAITDDIKARNALPASGHVEQLKRIFRTTSDNKVRLSSVMLKQKNKWDFVERISVLFLYAYELNGRESVLRGDLVEILNNAQVLDSNAHRWIRTSTLIWREDTSVGLSPYGRDRAPEMLREIQDSTIETTWMPGNKTSRRSGKAVASENDSEQQEGKKASRGRRAKSNSYTSLVRRLLDEGFFENLRTGEEVRAELIKRGHTFALGRITEALVRITKTELLTRQQNQSGDWSYRVKQTK